MDLIHGFVEKLIADASQIDGLTKTQFGDSGKAENLDARVRKRGRIVLKRRTSEKNMGQKPTRNNGSGNQKGGRDRWKPRSRTRGTTEEKRRRG